jgi:predicted ribosomally synthesized peptide with SipW-like signal peptide
MKEKLKKSVKPILSLMLVFALVFTGIFAYLTAKDSATNTFTVGNVDILLYEDDWYDHDTYADTGTKTILNDENENDIPDFAENIVPGQKIAKAPYVENTGRNEAWVYLVVSVPTATESQVLSDDTGSYGINTTQNINVTAYAIQDGYGEQDTLETVWETFGADLDGVYEAAEDTTDRIQLFSMINSSDEIGINDGWTQIDMNGTDDGMVYESADGNNYYVYGYSTKLAAGTSTSKLFDKVQFITSVGEPTKVTVWFFKETVNTSEDTSGEASGEDSEESGTDGTEDTDAGTAGTEVDLAVEMPVINNYELLTSVTLNKGDTLNATPRSDDITKTGTNSYYWVNSTDSTQQITAGQVVTEDIIAIPEYSVVKLMPADGNETVMIERAGKVETNNDVLIKNWNEAKTKSQKAQYAPYGLSSVELAFDTTYGDYDKSDYSTWFVYGFTTRLKKADIDSYIKVSGDGRYEILNLKGNAMTKNNELGTGFVINVYDQNGTPDNKEDDKFVEKFYVVIFGDLTGDGRVNDNDTSVGMQETNNLKWSQKSNSETYVPYLVRAVDFTHDDRINGNDISQMREAMVEKRTIDQTSGRAVIN